jgi:plastocyanin
VTRVKAMQINALCRRAVAIALILATTAPTPAWSGTLTVRVAAGERPMDDAVVFAVPKDVPVSPAKAGTRAVMIQEGQQFAPFVLPVQVGTTVEFPNRDPFRHHVYSFSPAKTFELKLYGGGEAQAVTFDKEGPVALGCNIHDNMLAYVYVVPTPYFGKVENGSRTLTVPAGTYVVKAWHPDQRSATPAQEVTVGKDGEVKVDLALTVKRERRPRRPSGADDNAY